MLAVTNNKYAEVKSPNYRHNAEGCQICPPHFTHPLREQWQAAVPNQVQFQPLPFQQSLVRPSRGLNPQPSTTTRPLKQHRYRHNLVGPFSFAAG